MNYCRNEKGIALVMALILSLIALSVVSALVYFITLETQMSGIQKRYQTAREAALGAIQLTTNEFVPTLISGNALNNAYVASFNISTGSCFTTRIQNSTASYGGACTIPAVSPCAFTTDPLDPACNPDVTFKLQGVPPAPPFRVSMKVVDTIEGNTDPSGLDLVGLGVVESQGLSPAHNPYMYSFEVSAKRCDPNDCNNPAKDPTGERANISVLYGF